MLKKETSCIDDIGWRILMELQRNARISFKLLAEKVNLSPTAVIERVKRMEEEGIITGYKATIDSRKVGYQLSALISLASDYGNPDQIINEALAKIPEVVSCWSVTGTNDYLMEVQVPSLEFLEELLGLLARHGRLTTSIVLPTSVLKRVLPQPRESITE